MFHDRTQSYGNSTWEAVHMYIASFKEKKVCLPNIMKAAINSNAPTCMVHMYDNEPSRLVAEQDNMTRSDNQDI